MISQHQLGANPKVGARQPLYYLVKFSCKCIKMIKFEPRGKLNAPPKFYYADPTLLSPSEIKPKENKINFGLVVEIIFTFQSKTKFHFPTLRFSCLFDARIF